MSLKDIPFLHEVLYRFLSAKFVILLIRCHGDLLFFKLGAHGFYCVKKQNRPLHGCKCMMGNQDKQKCYSWSAVFVVAICAHMPCAHVVVENRHV